MMKKFAAMILIATMLLSVAAVCCAEEATGEYVLFNKTGEALTELYIYPVGSEDKGENRNEGFNHQNYKTETFTGAPDTKLVLEFTTESGYHGQFDTLSIEVAPITLLAEDAKTGATDISFTRPEETGVYTVYNVTGEALAELYLYPAGSEEKGENLAASFVDGADITYTGAADLKLTVEFTTESGYHGQFDTLSIEVAPISLLAEDAKTGATDISFFAPAK